MNKEQSRKQDPMKWYQCTSCLNRFLSHELVAVQVRTKIQRSPMWVAVCSECLDKIEEAGILVNQEVSAV